jgi:alkaline phosphatase
MKLLTDAFEQSFKKETEKNESLYLLYGDYDPLAVTVIHILDRKAGIGWTTYSHTGIPVPTYASGTGHEIFNGFYDNTDIFKKLSSVMKVQ